MYRVIKLTENNVDVFIVLSVATSKEVFRADTYDAAYRFVLSK